MGKFASVLIFLALAWTNADPARGGPARGVMVEDFESGSVTLESYPDQDQEPNHWELTTSNTYGGTQYALRIYGNSWKTQEIFPVAITDSTVWSVAIYVEDLGEMQAFGVSDGTNELLYTFAGEQLPQDDKWWTVYQGAFDHHEWHVYLLPLGVAWQATYGYLPTISRLIYVNDDDGGGQNGTTIFDEIHDVTEDLPVVPTADIQYTIESSVALSKGLYRVGVQFHGLVFDPDSPSHDFHWDFGDSSSSTEQNPLHEFLVAADYTYTVGFRATDPDGLAGHDTCQVMVELGTADLPVTVNFVGDVFTGRQYEYPGGIIDTYGIEALFEPTLPIFGQAADVSVCNMEVCYTDQGTPHPTKSVVFRSRPENIVGLVYAGIDVVDIANNHIIDYGEEGMLQCLSLLDGLNIPYSGAGINEYFALQPAFWTEQGVRIAFLGQCNRCGRTWNYQPFLDAGYNKPGFAYFVAWNLERALGETQGLADIIVLQTHSGDEYEPAPPPGKGVAYTAPPPVEAAESHPDDPEFRFRTEPSPGDRALRRLALDLGADVLINHHPHVLQGFEGHDGKLIAHSLGNFIFDLSYIETFPTLVLTLEMDKEGIVGYTCVPAWIDDFIPHPATGQLGREILDRLADYSRPMNALLAVHPEQNLARIFPSRDEADSSVVETDAPVALIEEDGFAICPPTALAGPGNLSQVISVIGDAPGGWEVRWGREILWHGGFEAEGATLWDDNTSDEWLDDTESHGGLRSLALRRDDSDHQEVGTDLEKHLPCDGAKEHSFCGWLKADNADQARTLGRFYDSRNAQNHITSTDLAPRFTGSTDWIFQWLNLETPSHSLYFEVRCAMDPPASGTGHAWFDDIMFVEWEPWVPADSPASVPSPNNFRFLQVRCSDPAATTATVTFAQTVYDSPLTHVGGTDLTPRRTWLRNFPNPFNPRTTIELALPPSAAPVPVTLAVYDLRGRRVTTLFSGTLRGGNRHGFTWDGRDDAGRPVASGTYFVRARIGEEIQSRKLLLLR